MGLRTPLGRVRGLGSAKDGTAHWWSLRLTAVALAPLALWFVASLAGMTGADHAAVTAWIAKPAVAITLVILIVAVFHHAQLGLQVVIEDYVDPEWLKIAAVVAMKFAAFVLALASLFSVLKIAFGG